MLGQAAGEGDPGGKAWGAGSTPRPRELGPELAGGNWLECQSQAADLYQEPLCGMLGTQAVNRTGIGGGS